MITIITFLIEITKQNLEAFNFVFLIAKRIRKIHNFLTLIILIGLLFRARVIVFPVMSLFLFYFYLLYVFFL